MNIVETIKNTDKTLISLEIVPPLRGHSLENIYKTLDPLMEYKPSFINVTYHREEIKYVPHPDGTTERRKINRRPGSVGISVAVKYKYNVEVVPHILCGGFSRHEIEQMLIDYSFLEFDNLFALRGDALKGEKSFVPHAVGHANAVGLVKQIADMNNGIYLDQPDIGARQTNFSIGVAGYPEKHSEAADFQTDLQRLKEKVDAGAGYVVTQMFYDNQKFFQFVEACRNIGITIPIIPGLNPFANFNHLKVLPQLFHIELPQDLVHEVNRCKTNDDVSRVGVEWAVMQCHELKERGVPVIHFFTMSQPENVENIIRRVF
jgi:methylenetetrahydrofolate reductase (NADPH)